MVITYSSNWKSGACKLCLTHTEHLERHHISYKPEITIDLCHQCHFTAHFFPNRLRRDQKLLLLEKRFNHAHALALLALYENNPVSLAKLFAPSRRESIHKAQKEELERIKKEEEIIQKQ